MFNGFTFQKHTKQIVGFVVVEYQKIKITTKTYTYIVYYYKTKKKIIYVSFHYKIIFFSQDSVIKKYKFQYHRTKRLID